MIILKEKDSVIREGTWGKLSQEKAFDVFCSAISDLDKFEKKYYSTIGDDELFDAVEVVKNRVASLTAVSLAMGMTKNHFHGTKPTRDIAKDWITNMISNMNKGLLSHFPQVDYAWVFSNAMHAAGY